MRITEQEQKNRRKQMIFAAYRLFCEYGIDNVSMARIAEEAGVSPNSIFRYFESKVMLLQETQAILWTEIVDCITVENRRSIEKVNSGLEEVKILLYGFQNLYENHSKYVLFAYEYKAYLIRNNVCIKAEELDDTLDDIRQIFIYSLDKGQADGSITKKHSPAELFQFIWAFMRSFVEQLVVQSQICKGVNPWIGMFPMLVNKIINELNKADYQQETSDKGLG